MNDEISFWMKYNSERFEDHEVRLWHCEFWVSSFFLSVVKIEPENGINLLRDVDEKGMKEQILKITHFNGCCIFVCKKRRKESSNNLS